MITGIGYDLTRDYFSSCLQEPETICPAPWAGVADIWTSPSGKRNGRQAADSTVHEINLTGHKIIKTILQENLKFKSLYLKFLLLTSFCKQNNAPNLWATWQ